MNDSKTGTCVIEYLAVGNEGGTASTLERLFITVCPGPDGYHRKNVCIMPGSSTGKRSVSVPFFFASPECDQICLAVISIPNHAFSTGRPSNRLSHSAWLYRFCTATFLSYTKRRKRGYTTTNWTTNLLKGHKYGHNYPNRWIPKWQHDFLPKKG